MYKFLDAYLVAGSNGSPPVGAVRREGKVWRIMLFGVQTQPKDVFATRGDAAARLMALAASIPNTFYHPVSKS